MEPLGKPTLGIVSPLPVGDQWMTDNEKLLRDIYAEVRELRAEDRGIRREMDLQREAGDQRHMRLEESIRVVETRMWAALGGSLLSIISVVLGYLMK